MDPCPEFRSSACCNPTQYQVLGVHLAVSAAAFSLPSDGGTPACGENLRQLWCGVTCHPNQSMWVFPAANNTVIDNDPVMPATINLGSDFACGLFDSCKATSRASEDQILSTGVTAFLNFMGRDQGKDNGVWYTFEYINDNSTKKQGDSHVAKDKSMTEATLPELATPNSTLLPYWNPPVQFCCSYEASIYQINTGNPPPVATGNLTSPCAACKSSCPREVCPAGVQPAPPSGDLGAPMFGAMYGFDVVVVSALYGTIAVITTGLVLWNRQEDRRKLLGEDPDVDSATGQ